MAAFCSHSGAILEACSCYLGALLEYLLGSALSVVVLVLFALLALEPFGRELGGMFVLFGALLEYLLGSALSVGVLALLALLDLAFEPNQCKNLSSVSLSGPWQVSLPLLLRLSERAKRASEGITWPARCLLML